MTWQEALEEIQSAEFDVNLNVVSGTNAFFRAISREPAVIEAFLLMQQSGELREDVYGRIFGLAQEETDPQYQNPNDTALSVLLWLTRFTAPEIVNVAATLVDQTPRCWYSKELAQRILNPPPSATGTVSEFPDHLGGGYHSKNMINNSMGREFAWAHLPKEAHGSRFTFPTKYSSTPDVNWGISGVPNVENREGTE